MFWCQCLIEILLTDEAVVLATDERSALHRGEDEGLSQPVLSEQRRQIVFADRDLSVGPLREPGDLRRDPQDQLDDLQSLGSLRWQGLSDGSGERLKMLPI